MEVRLRNGNVIKIARVDPEHEKLRGDSALVLSTWIWEAWQRGLPVVAAPDPWPIATVRGVFVEYLKTQGPHRLVGPGG